MSWPMPPGQVSPNSTMRWPLQRQVLQPGPHALCEGVANCWSRGRTHLLRVRTTSLGSSPRNKGSRCRTPQVKYRTRFDVIRSFSSLDLPLQVIKEDEGQKIVRQHTPLGVVAAIIP